MKIHRRTLTLLHSVVWLNGSFTFVLQDSTNAGRRQGIMDLEYSKRGLETETVESRCTELSSSLRVEEYEGAHISSQVPVIGFRSFLGLSVNYAKKDAKTSNLERLDSAHHDSYSVNEGSHLGGKRISCPRMNSIFRLDNKLVIIE